MVEVRGMGFIRSLTHGKEHGATLLEIPEDESAPLDHDDKLQRRPSSAVPVEEIKSTGRRTSHTPPPRTPDSESRESPIRSPSMKIRGLSAETNDNIRRSTPVVEFIEFYRSQYSKTRPKVKAIHRRRNSEPPPKLTEETRRNFQGSKLLNGGTSQMTSPASKSLGNMGKSTSLKDIFTLRKAGASGIISNITKPSQFLAHLRGPSPSAQVLQRLQHILETHQWAFIEKFVRKGGAMVLCTLISSQSFKKGQSVDDTTSFNAGSSCIFALLALCEEKAELCEGMELAINSLLATAMPRTDCIPATCVSQINTITTMCGNKLGHKFILSEMKERDDFPLLVTLLSSDLDVQNVDHLLMKIEIFSLINKLIKNTEDAEDKFNLINDFLKLKIFPVMMDLRRLSLGKDDLLSAITEFEDALTQGYFQLIARANTFDGDYLSCSTIAVYIPVAHITYARMMVPYEPSESTFKSVVNYVFTRISYLVKFVEEIYCIFAADRSASQKKFNINRRNSFIKIRGQHTPNSAKWRELTKVGTLVLKEHKPEDSVTESPLTRSEEFLTPLFDDLGLEEDGKKKSPREATHSERRYKRASSKFSIQNETIVKNPLYGKTNPMLSPKHRLQHRRLSVYTKRVLEFKHSYDTEMTPTKGEWISGSQLVSQDEKKGIYEFRIQRWEITVSWKSEQVVLSVEPELVTCSDVVELVMLKLKKNEEDRVFEYALVMKVYNPLQEEISYVWLEPMRYIDSLPPRTRDFEIRTKPIPLNIRSKDGTTHAVLVSDTTTVQEVILEFGNRLGLQGRHLQDYGLFDEISKEWLDSGYVSSLLQRANNINLHFLLRPRPICVLYQIQEYDLSRLGPVKTGVVNIPTSDPLPLYESPTLSHVLASSPRPQREFESHSFKSADVLVHFTLCVSEVHIGICRELVLDPEEYRLFREADGTELVELTLWKSLRNQGVAPNSRILMLQTGTKEETRNDVDIWEEQPSKDTVRFEENSEEKQVIAGTLNQLVRILTSENELDTFYMKTFMLTYRSFTDYKTLLRKLGERYACPPNVSERVKKIVKARVGVVLKHWITHEDPTEKEAILDEIEKFVDSIEEEFSDLANMLSKTIQNERVRLSSPRNETVEYPDENVRLSPGLYALNFLDLDEYTIACQLTLLDYERYTKLKSVEFFNQNWLRGKAPNLLAMVAHFNSVSSAVATSIVTERLIKKRAKIVEKHIVIAQCLRKVNNFFSLQAFICGLNNSAVNRLKYTMERVSSQHLQTLEELEELMSMENSYKKYREALRNAVPPRIPHLGVYMTDLTFIDEGNPDKFGDLINFQKRALVGKIIEDIESHRKEKYQLIGSKKIEQFFNHLQRLPEPELFKLSLSCEPRGATKSELK